jgi:AbrB family looped-hinge helix DNA binding protein
MKLTVQIDKAGRIVLPKKIRDRFGLSSGDDIDIQDHGNKIELTPVKKSAHLKEVNGILVAFSDENAMPNRDFVEESRNERMDELSKGFFH